jgi:quinol monooxygenase YgiN
MHGLIGKMTTQPGRRDELVSLLLKSTVEMPGCLSYVIAADSNDTDAIWVTEVWDNEASWSASLQLPEVQAAIAEARPLIVGMEPRYVTTPFGGTGLPR